MVSIIMYRREREFKVVIKFAARADLHHLGMFLQGRQADAPQEALQVLDIVLRELPTSRYVLLSSNIFTYFQLFLPSNCAYLLLAPAIVQLGVLSILLT